MDTVPDRKKYEYKVSADDKTYAARLLAMVGRGKRVLEVGCASGSQTRALAEEMACTVVGIEIDAAAAERARPHCERLIVGDVETLPLEELLDSARFDAVMFADVLEHLRDPAATLRKCRKLLTRDGFVVASVPNVTHAAVTYELAHGRFDYREKGLLDDTHIRFFSRDSVTGLFESADFLIEIMDRKVSEPQSTEFETCPESPDDRALLRYIFDHNPEATTYQFLIRAIPMDSNTQLREAALQMRRQIDSLERTLHEKERELNRLQSQVDWLETHPLRGAFGAVRRLFSRTRSNTTAKTQS